MVNKPVWIKNEILNWRISPFGGGIVSSNDNQIRAYEHWDHAEKLLTLENSKLHRVDAISTLKRCLNQRLKLIESMYNFKHIRLSSSPKGYLEYLETFGLVRPLMLKRLMTLRNNIEHNDCDPPKIDRCLELLDLMWYFLKSTDNILYYKRDLFDYELCSENGEATQYGFELDIDYEQEHKIKLTGWFPSNFISIVQKDLHIEFLVNTMYTKLEKCKNKKKHKDKLDSDIWVIGTFADDARQKQSIFKRLFNATST